MTDRIAILEYIDFYGEFVPAKMIGKKWNDHLFGSEVGKRCRELRAEGLIVSTREGKFEKYLKISEKNRILSPSEFAQINAGNAQERLFELPKITSV